MNNNIFRRLVVAFLKATGTLVFLPAVFGLLVWAIISINPWLFILFAFATAFTAIMHEFYKHP